MCGSIFALCMWAWIQFLDDTYVYVSVDISKLRRDVSDLRSEGLQPRNCCAPLAVSKSSYGNLLFHFFVYCFFQNQTWDVQCQVKGGPQPLDKEIHEIFDSKRENRFSNPFFELVPQMCQVRFSYLLPHGNSCKAPRTPCQKCQKITGCWGPAVYVRNLWSSRNLGLPLLKDPVQTIARVNHGLRQRTTVTQFLVLRFIFFNQKSVTKLK